MSFSSYASKIDLLHTEHFGCTEYVPRGGFVGHCLVRGVEGDLFGAFEIDVVGDGTSTRANA
jgi:hypothetical protein